MSYTTSWSEKAPECLFIGEGQTRGSSAQGISVLLPCSVSCRLLVQPSTLSLSPSPSPELGTTAAARAQHRLGLSSPGAAVATGLGWMFQASWSCWLPMA